MINKDRIVPIQKTDFLTLIGTIMNLTGSGSLVIKATDTIGDFKVTEGGTYLANEPLKSCDFADGDSSAMYFVPAYDFKGFTIGGAPAEYAEGAAKINPDGITLYAAQPTNGAIQVVAISPVADDNGGSDPDEHGDDSDPVT